MSKKKLTQICPHCGNEAQYEVLFTTNKTIEIEVWEKEVVDFDFCYALIKCDTCDEISFLSGFCDGGIEEMSFKYPAEKSFLLYLPDQINRSYGEAKRIKKISPLAFVVLVRRALEFLCEEKNAVGKNLNDKIEDLAKKQVIPGVLSTMAHKIRFLGNVGAHAGSVTIEKSEADIMDDFFLAVLEYVYVAPRKIENLQKKLSKKLNK